MHRLVHARAGALERAPAARAASARGSPRRCSTCSCRTSRGAWLCRAAVARVSHGHRAVRDLPARTGPRCSVAADRLLDGAGRTRTASSPSSTSSRNSTPPSGGAGSTRSPTVARNGLAACSISSAAAPLPAGRSMQIVGRLAERRLDPVVLRERGLDDLLLHLAVEQHRGPSAARRSAARSAGPARRAPSSADVQARRGRPRGAPRRPSRASPGAIAGEARAALAPDRVADARVASPHSLPIRPRRRRRRARDSAPSSKTSTAVTLPRSCGSAAGRAYPQRPARTCARRRPSRRPARARS